MLNFRDLFTIRRFIVIICFFIGCKTAIAQGFHVNKFSAEIYLSTEGYFDVVENYDVTFLVAKHGLYRSFETKLNFQNSEGKVSKKTLYITDIEVPDQHFSTNTLFDFPLGDELTIRIGDKKKSVTGNQQYEIRYRVKNAIFFDEGRAQFYWNVKADKWSTVFNEISFRIHAPEGFEISPDNCFVYSGKTGNTELSREFEYQYDGNVFSAASIGDINSYYGESVTVLLNMPERMISEQKPSLIWEYFWVGILLIIYLITLIINRIYGKRKKVISITSYYPPEGMDPAMAGVMIDNMPDRRDIICLLPFWATLGIIKMEEIEKGERSFRGDLKLIKLKDLPESAAGYEHNFFSKIFTSSNRTEVLVSSLGNIVLEPQQLLSQKFKSTFQKKRPRAKRTWGCLLALWAIGGSVLFFFIWGWIAILANFVVAAFFAVISSIRERTPEGDKIFSEVLGFKQFIKTAEVERIKMLLKEDPYYFEKTMPYAVAFNLLKEWTGKFEGLLTQAPAWYTGTSGTRFQMNTFSSAFSNSMKVASSSMISTSSGGSSSRSGGGSSGGGAGRGGGGSW